MLVGQCPKAILCCFFFPKLAVIYNTAIKVYSIDL